MKDPRRHGFWAGVAVGWLVMALAVNAGPLEDAMSSGRTFFDQKDYLHAYEQFKIAFELNPQDPGINFYLGRAAFELGDYENAYMAFDRVENLNPNFPRVKLELARTYLELGIHDMAKELFTEILATNPPPTVRQNINQFLDRIDKSKQRSFFMGALELGMQYDSNPKTSPTSNQMEIISGGQSIPFAIDPGGRQKADVINTTQLSLNHIYRWPDTPWSWKSILNEYSAFHNQQNDLDINYLNVTTGPRLDTDKWWANLAATGSYVQLDYDDYFVSGGIMGEFNLTLNPFIDFKVGTQLDARRYLSDPQRDAGNAILSGGPIFKFGPNKIEIRVGTERENSTDDTLSYHKYFAAILYERRLPWDMVAYASLRYQQSLYDKRASYLPEKRSDQVHEVTVGLSKTFRQRFTVSLTHAYTQSDSTLPLYTYDRQVTGLSLIIGL